MCFHCHQISAAVITNLLAAEMPPLLPFLVDGMDAEPQGHHRLRYGLALLCAALQPVGEDATHVLLAPNAELIADFRQKFTVDETERIVAIAHRMGEHLSAVEQFIRNGLLTGAHDAALRASAPEQN